MSPTDEEREQRGGLPMLTSRNFRVWIDMVKATVETGESDDAIDLWNVCEWDLLTGDQREARGMDRNADPIDRSFEVPGAGINATALKAFKARELLMSWLPCAVTVSQSGDSPRRS